jgi:hypothetical protein
VSDLVTAPPSVERPEACNAFDSKPTSHAAARSSSEAAKSNDALPYSKVAESPFANSTYDEDVGDEDRSKDRGNNRRQVAHARRSPGLCLGLRLWWRKHSQWQCFGRIKRMSPREPSALPLAQTITSRATPSWALHLPAPGPNGISPTRSAHVERARA